MFTLKFSKLDKDNRLIEHCISCASFEVVHFNKNKGYEIVAYPNLRTDDETAVSVRVVNEQETPSEYSSCYVENSAGKTIGHYYSKTK